MRQEARAYACSVCLGNEFEENDFKGPGQLCHRCRAGGVCDRCAGDVRESDPGSFLELTGRCPYCRCESWWTRDVPLDIYLGAARRRARPRRRMTGIDAFSRRRWIQERADPQVNALLTLVLVERLSVVDDHRGARGGRLGSIADCFAACALLAAFVNVAHFYVLIQCMLPYARSNFSAWFLGAVFASTQTMVALLNTLRSARYVRDLSSLCLLMRWSSSMVSWSRCAMKDMLGLSVSSSSVEAYLTGLVWMARYRGASPGVRRGPLPAALVVLAAVSTARFLQHVCVDKCRTYRNQAALTAMVYSIIVPRPPGTPSG